VSHAFLYCLTWADCIAHMCKCLYRVHSFKKVGGGGAGTAQRTAGCKSTSHTIRLPLVHAYQTNKTLLCSKNAESTLPAQHAESSSIYASSGVSEDTGPARCQAYNTNKHGLNQEMHVSHKLSRFISWTTGHLHQDKFASISACWLNLVIHARLRQTFNWYALCPK